MPDEEAPRRPGGIKSLTPRKVSHLAADSVHRRVVGDAQEGTRIALHEASPAGVDLVGWALANRQRLTAELHDGGGVFLRGFDVSTPEQLERFASVFVTDLLGDNGEHPRASVNGKIYTPVSHPPDEKLLWHTENSFNASGPTRIWFACATPAATGGETPVVDSRAVHRRLAPEIRDAFARKGVMYVRTYGAALGLHWREVFRTDSRAEAEDRCRRSGLSYDWHGDVLRTSCVRPGVLRHPVTGQMTWFNQAQHWHTSCLGAEAREALHTVFGEEDLPRACFFGDGSPIPDEVMAEILRVYADLEVTIPWQRGDVMFLDNLLMAHGRNPYRGERKLLVAMGGLIDFSDKGA
ncbi:TauD/TfdA family dioxygenase [Streptomyces sp. CJ_13]|uniref:TauD/TfdA family dioxygenase n=1 Tax=Streptomyces sp. CJ_13 TaxID=2724943 RepID=UPI001BDBC07A|nr:TauD/TfdA family dioxygenase [Streptomyces sp. CJ_13]MBT1187497.1 TauD/TfdA family dioxygenase [Streptomyces sp. CJ_13]